jgi:hypothetical protein
VIPQHTCVNKLFGYDLTVEYRPGKLNAATDALSRHEEDIVVVHTISTPTFALVDNLQTEFQQDAEAIEVRTQLARGIAVKGWSLYDDMVLFKGKIFIPEASSLWPELMSHAHNGHEGVQKTMTCWRASFYSPHALCRARDFIRGCAVCQRNKSEHLHPTGLLQPLPVLSQVWSDISIDFIEGFPKVGGKSVVLTVVDIFFKFTHFIALSGQGIFRRHCLAPWVSMFHCR